MSALMAAHTPETKKRTLTLPISDIRKNDVIVDGVDITGPVIVKRIFDPGFENGSICLTLVDPKNRLYYRQYPAAMLVTINN